MVTVVVIFQFAELKGLVKSTLFFVIPPQKQAAKEKLRV